MTILEFNPEHRVRERLDHGAFDLMPSSFANTTSLLALVHPGQNLRAFRPHRHGVLGVGAQLAVLLTTVQPSGCVTTSGAPAFTIGSIATTCPAISRGPRSGTP